mmetsp:Transcript_44654/g.123768  ORF Transcript_44654/g.123768 Transcript_44654/m.123768 type:complete len:218 (+) Transcript_44654:95-748(+)
MEPRGAHPQGMESYATSAGACVSADPPDGRCMAWAGASIGTLLPRGGRRAALRESRGVGTESASSESWRTASTMPRSVSSSCMSVRFSSVKCAMSFRVCNKASASCLSSGSSACSRRAARPTASDSAARRHSSAASVSGTAPAAGGTIASIVSISSSARTARARALCAAALSSRRFASAPRCATAAASATSRCNSSALARSMTSASRRTCARASSTA